MVFYKRVIQKLALITTLIFFSASAFANSEWLNYYDFNLNAPPHEQTWGALKIFQEKNPKKDNLTAIDLGCGDGRDTFLFMERGFKVLAIDGDVEGIKRLKSNSKFDPKKIEVKLQSFEDIDHLPEADFINAMPGSFFGEPLPEKISILKHEFKVRTDDPQNGIPLSLEEFFKLFSGFKLYYYSVELKMFSGKDKLFSRPYYFFVAIKDPAANKKEL